MLSEFSQSSMHIKRENGTKSHPPQTTLCFLTATSFPQRNPLPWLLISQTSSHGFEMCVKGSYNKDSSVATLFHSTLFWFYRYYCTSSIFMTVLHSIVGSIPKFLYSAPFQCRWLGFFLVFSFFLFFNNPVKNIFVPSFREYNYSFLLTVN